MSSYNSESADNKFVARLAAIGAICIISTVAVITTTSTGSNLLSSGSVSLSAGAVSLSAGGAFTLSAGVASLSTGVARTSQLQVVDPTLPGPINKGGRSLTYGNADKGDRFQLLCPQNQFVTSITGKSGWYVNALDVVCSDGADLGKVGGYDGEDVTMPNCVSGVREIDITYNNDVLGKIVPYCDGMKQAPIGAGNLEESGKIDGYFLCPQISGSKELKVFAGIFGTADDTGVHSIGFICAADSDATPQPVDQPTQAPVSEPTLFPTAEPVASPTVSPSQIGDTMSPIADPTPEPTLAPTLTVEEANARLAEIQEKLVAAGVVSAEPTAAPTEFELIQFTMAPIPDPTASPTFEPTLSVEDANAKLVELEQKLFVASGGSA